MKAACEAGQLTIVQWLARSPYFGACFKPTQAVCKAVRLGHMGVLEWLRANRTDICWRRPLKAVDGNHLDVAKWLQPMTGRDENRGRMWIVPAAGAGNLEMVKWAYRLKGRTPAKTRKAVEAAARSGHADIVQWLLEQKGPCAAQSANASGLLKEGNMETLEMLLAHRAKLNDETWVRGLPNAVASGHPDVVKRLFECGFTLNFDLGHGTSTAISDAARKGHFEMLKSLVEHRIRAQIFTPQMIYSAAAGGQLNILKWLCENSSADCNRNGAKRAVEAAASCGHIDVLRWLHDCNSSGFTFRAMDNAATYNRREVVEWLHVNRTEGSTTRAMDGAAEYGHLDMVKWLHANRREGCTKAAMDMAAMNGHLEIAKWLHANRSEGCTTAALKLSSG